MSGDVLVVCKGNNARASFKACSIARYDLENCLKDQCLCTTSHASLPGSPFNDIREYVSHCVTLLLYSTKFAR